MEITKKYLINIKNNFMNLIKNIFGKENLFPISEKEIKILDSSILQDLKKKSKIQKIPEEEKIKENENEEEKHSPILFTKKNFDIIKNFKNKILRDEIIFEESLKKKFINFLERYKKSEKLTDYFLDIKNEKKNFKFFIKKKIEFKKKNNFDFCKFFEIKIIKEKKKNKLCLLKIYSIGVKNYNFLVFSTNRILKRSLKHFSKIKSITEFEEKLYELKISFFKNLVYMYFFTNFEEIKENEKIYEVEVFSFDLKNK